MIQEKRQIRVGFIIRGAIIGIAATVLLLPTLAGIGFIASLMMPLCGVSGNPHNFSLTFENLTIPAPSLNTSMRAYFIPAQNPPNGNVNGTIIGVPTGASGRADRLHELQVFVQAGYNVLAFESRTCANGAINSLGYGAVAQVGDALDYLRTRDDVDMARIGIHGFSAGGASAIMAAARHPEISAVIAQGGYHNFSEEVAHNTRVWDETVPFIGSLFRFGINLGYRVLAGDDISVLDPLSMLDAISPRPILLVYGSNEPGMRGANMMLAAGDSVELWVVDGAGHGNYVQVVGAEAYAAHTVAFWDRVLGR